MKRNRMKAARSEGARETLRRMMREDDEIPFSEQVFRFLVVGLAIAYSFLMLN